MDQERGYSGGLRRVKIIIEKEVEMKQENSTIVSITGLFISLLNEGKDEVSSSCSRWQ